MFTDIADVINIPPPNPSVGTEDATTLDSPDATREHIPTLIEPGNPRFEMNFIPGAASDDAVVAWLYARSTKNVRITYQDGATVIFAAFVTGLETAAPIDGRMTATVSLQITGRPVRAAAAAPANIILPAVSGIAQVGETLTALEGTWSGAPVFTYQWQENDSGWANLVGAVNRTYDPVVGVVGNPLRVIVTGTNLTGAASATSGPTADVLAE